MGGASPGGLQAVDDMSYSPGELQDIDSVRVSQIIGADLEVDRVTDYLLFLDDLPSVSLVAAEAKSIADLWRRLPPGGQDRCHLPPYGVQFFSDGTLLLAASVCWECNNIFGSVAGEGIHYEFSAESPAAEALLARFRALAFPAL